MVGVLTWETLSYFMALYGTKIFSDLGSMVSNYNTLSDDKILHIDKWSVGVSKEAPELTGGVTTGNTVMNLEYDSDNSQYIATQTGTLFTVKAPALVKGLLNALGAKVTTTNEVSEKIASALSLAFDTYITIANMNEYSIPVLLNNGKTFVSKDIIKAVADALFDVGMFSSGGVSSSINWEQVNTGRGYINLVIPDVGNMTEQLAVIKNGISVVAGINPSTRMNFLNGAIGGIYGDFISRLRHVPKAIEFSIVYYNNYFSVYFYACNASSGEFYYPYGKFLDSYNNYRLSVESTGSPFPLYVYKVYDNSWSYDYTTSSPTITIGTLLQRTTSEGNSMLGVCTIGSVLTPAVDGIDIPDSTTTPRDNDIDIDTTYPEWVQHQIDIGWYDSIVNALRNGRALPIDLNDALTIGDAGEFVIDQATAQTGVLDDTDTTAKTTAVQGATVVIPALVTFEGTRVDTTDIPDVTPAPTPTPVIPTGGTNSAGLATIFNITNEQLSSLRGVLWERNLIADLTAIFSNNPADAIVSLHKVYCTPNTNGTGSIKLGYVLTGINDAKIVSNQYTTIQCGEVNVPEIYGNATDYEPYTSVSIYLPFIGIKDLSAKDIVGGKLKITYVVDVTTGTCIAQLFVTKYGATQMLYTFDGNCSVEIPITGSDHSRMVAGLIQAGISYAAGKNAYTAGQNKHPMARISYNASAASQASGSLIHSVDITRSGNLTSNAGAMNIKKPYLIINRMIPYEASNYNELYGFPSNKRVKLSTVSGYTRVADVHVENMACTDSEKQEIERLLMEGVFL